MRDKSHVSGPLDSLWQAHAIMWVLIAGEGLAIVLALAPDMSSDRWVLFGLASICIQWVALLTLGELYLLRQVRAAANPMGVAWISIGLLIVNTWIVLAAIRVISPGVDQDSRDDHTLLFWQATGIVTTVGLLGLAAFQNHWRARQLDLRAKQAELEALQARIRPHFLFNTLNTGAALVHSRPEEAERLLLDLADLFRAALAGPRDISLEDELSLVRRYMEIEQLRFGERLRVDWDVPAVIPDAQVPSLSIQPLVENAIRHGVERVPHGGRVEIALTTTAEHVVVRIRNPLVFSDARPPMSHGVGLNASQARIEALTGGRGSVQTGRQGEHWVATVRLPRRPASGDRRRRV